MLPVLPPGLDSLHSLSFGSLTISCPQLNLSPPIPGQPILSLKFLGQSPQQHQNLKPNSPLTYSIHCSAWHFHQYLSDMETLSIDVKVKQSKSEVLVGQVKVFLPAMMGRMQREMGNVVEKAEGDYVVVPVGEPLSSRKDVGRVRLVISTLFDQRFCQLARPFIAALLTKHQDRQTIKQLPNPQQKKIDSSDILDLSRQCNMIPPIPISKAPAKYPLVFSSEQLSLQQQSKLIQDDIDRMVADLQSREYDSSKYQDQSQEIPTGYKSTLTNNPVFQSPVLPVFQISEYSLKNQNKTMAGTVSYEHPVDYTMQSSIPFTYSKLTKESTFEPKPQCYLQTQPKALSSKTLNLQIHELSFSGMPYNEQQHRNLCNARLQIQFPNHQLASFIGKRSGETVAYDCKGYEVEVEEHTEQGEIRLFRGAENTIVFRVEELAGQELAYGCFDLARLIRAEGKGVFVVSLNNRNLKKDDSQKQTVSISPYQTGRLKPVSVCLYSLRVGIELLSHVKDKVYQLRLAIQSINDLAQTRKDLQIRYKLFGTQQSIQYDCQSNSQISHNMVMPILLESLIKDKNPKVIIQLWDKLSKSLIGLTELDLSPISKVLLREHGKLDQSALTTNLYPTMLYKGPQPIKNLISKRTQGTMVISLGFGNAKQINRLIEEQNRPPVLIPEVVKEEKKVVLPYDERMGVFVKEKKDRREVDVQVEPGELDVGFRQEHELSQIQHHPLDEQPSHIEHSCLEQIKQISTTPQPILLASEPLQQPQILQKPDPQLKIPVVLAPSPVPTLTQQYLCSLCNTLSCILSLNPNFPCSLKQLISPHLLFSFIDRTVLFNSILTLSIDQDTAQQLLSHLPTTSDMLIVTPLFDYFASFQCGGRVNEKLISEETLGEWMMEVYVRSGGMQVDTSEEMADLLEGWGYRVGDREIGVIWARYSKEIQHATWEKVQSKYRHKIERKQHKKRSKKSEQQKILQAIYAISDDSHISQPAKGGCLSVTLRGYQACVQSAQTLLNIPADTSKNLIRVTLMNKQKYQFVFNQDTAQQVRLPEPIDRQQFYEQKGSVELISENRVISRCAINLEGLALEQIDKTYALKTADGSFCGLVRLAINYLL